MNKVRHFLEYECSKCGATIHENPPRNPDRLTDRIVELNTEPAVLRRHGLVRNEVDCVVATK